MKDDVTLTISVGVTLADLDLAPADFYKKFLAAPFGRAKDTFKSVGANCTGLNITVLDGKVKS